MSRVFRVRVLCVSCVSLVCLLCVSCVSLVCLLCASCVSLVCLLCVSCVSLACHLDTLGPLLDANIISKAHSTLIISSQKEI